MSTTARRRTRWSALAGAVVLTLTTTVGVATASARTGGVQLADKPCGYSESDRRAWYNHCTTDGSRIQIRVDVVHGPDFNTCAEPGVNTLGWAFKYRNAWYTGKLCRPL
ncbi:hypothetical protein AR457_32535 [Streptomyces agglomeratus]|uniref:Secreted protein n=1 Tax=Streptomyces agglomeratus TaxID=285458 RepID=A0A1E5PK03_9ACTN|nr:hypothetical protein AS594_32445 [Streptomyces agglomeratus]OEJ37443.1 hypothetical protein BGK70_04120 [Streptomyces agglomeratus]OEJ49370.1 hypothetical protein AR457_32535 [Streptomyces agglomeratus]OEJ49985.1 hypothetical protein BGK72_03630 [Streptomyces agglomeratus]OEJ57313.1 hypothetical protein BGM19_04310 [Streptomyces agglomeratus]